MWHKCPLLSQSAVNVRVTTCPPEHYRVVGLCIWQVLRKGDLNPPPQFCPLSKQSICQKQKALMIKGNEPPHVTMGFIAIDLSGQNVETFLWDYTGDTHLVLGVVATGQQPLLSLQFQHLMKKIFFLGVQPLRAKSDSPKQTKKQDTLKCFYILH